MTCNPLSSVPSADFSAFFTMKIFVAQRRQRIAPKTKAASFHRRL
jgi:hypothetical protein